MQRLGLLFFFSTLFLAVFIQAVPLDGESETTLVRRKGLRIGGGGRPASRPPSRPPIVIKPKPTIIKKPHPTIIKKPHSETTIKKSTTHTESHSSTTPPSSQSATTPPSSQTHTTTSAPAASHTTTPPGGTLTGTGSASHSATRTSDPEATDTDLPNLPSVPTKTKKGLHWPTGASGEPLVQGGGLWRNLPGVSLSFDPSGAGWCRKIKVNIGAPGTGGIYGGGYGGGYGDTSGYPSDGSMGYKARAKRSKAGKKVRKGKGKGKGKKSKKTPKADRAAL
ncbi:hypothetical protein EXIGLDRAFT_755696 [Exidia glandulosa HHB12029]|uniref:Uncharacterized protein n=1 Tax=Exidia glandulosa HHB12029 TaxID=1314781 RepID=A0A165BU16_EXIGL|nr:hypothetical protein EXIGLDRAFT_755696 [Exidia glandulosa HHB12029]